MTVLQTIKEDLTKRKINGYELTTLLLRNGKRLKLKPSELTVFATLATYWNGKPVYPRITTLADNTAQSEKTVRTALSGLIQKGYLIKSKRAKNSNIYNINVNAVLSAVNSDIKSGKSDRTRAVNFTAPCIKSNHEEVEPTTKESTSTPSESTTETQHKNVVAFIPKSKSVTLADVPDIIKSNKKVQNPCAYWASLNDEVKKQYLKKQREKEENARKKLEIQKAEEEKRQKEREELERVKNEPPFWAVCTRAEAVEHLKKFSSLPLRKLLRTGYRAELMNKFDISMDELEGVKSA